MLSITKIMSQTNSIKMISKNIKGITLGTVIMYVNDVNHKPKHSTSCYDCDVSLHNNIPKKYDKLRNKIFQDWELPPWEVFIFKNKLLGEGSFSKVYLAKWRETLCVAKVINSDVAKNDKELILREIDIMTKLHHPNVVQFLGYIDDPFILVMEYIPNGNLLERMNNIKRKEKIIIMRDILQGLAYFHNRRPQSLIHRDIKPTNILLTPCNRAKITDFGISKLYMLKINSFNSDDTLTYTDPELTSNVGTKRYRAPETYKNVNYDKKVDIYSCGILLYEIFENKRYFPGEEMKWYWCPKNIRKIIQKNMLCSNPEDRYDALRILQIINKRGFKP
jgi:serine/threonine protein kinase